MTSTESQALAHRCPFCGAEPDQACRTHRGKGRELDSPHSRRIFLASPELQAIRAAARTQRQALCCECGNLRTFGRNYYPPRDENSGGGLFTDPRGWFDTGTLKCSHCGVRTRHALLAEEHLSDLAERYQAYVLGGAAPYTYHVSEDGRESLREQYFAQFPRNPFVTHKWWKADEDEAREAGRKQFRAMCGEMIDLPAAARPGATPSESVAPTQLTHPDVTEHENLDVDTGLWWTAEGWCVNCLKVRHDWLLKQQRKQLLVQLLEVSNAVDTMAAEDVTALREHLDRIMGSAR